MPRYLVQFTDLDAWPVEAPTRQQAKRSYCNMMGLTGRDDFIQPGFTIQKMTNKPCEWCHVNFDGTKDQTCCEACLAIAKDDAKIATYDLLHDGLAPMEWPHAMQKAFIETIHKTREAGHREIRRRQLDAAIKELTDDSPGIPRISRSG